MDPAGVLYLGALETQATKRVPEDAEPSVYSHWALTENTLYAFDLTDYRLQIAC